LTKDDNYTTQYNERSANINRR